MPDPRMIAGPALIVLGLLMLFVTQKLWLSHPLDRARRLGPFVTEAGLRAVVELRLTLVAFGLFLSMQGVASVVYWYFRREVDDPLVTFLGSCAAGLGVWAASLAVARGFRLWRAK